MNICNKSSGLPRLDPSCRSIYSSAAFRIKSKTLNKPTDKFYNKVVAEYALRDINKPIGISQYEAVIIESLPEDLKKSLVWFKWSISITIIVCVLQWFKVSQFWELLELKGHWWENNIVTGFIGNGTHLSAFLGMCVPLYFIKKRELKVCQKIL